tara:strand:- start:583 stop:999 length:417 start_codon:yes stop_codon:yes gene_type:complete
MIENKQAFIRAIRERLHEDWIRGFDSIESLGSILDVGIRYRYSKATKYQILHMFLNAGVSKTTLMKTHHRRFTGENRAWLWCSHYLRSVVHRTYAQKRKEELKDKGIYPYETSYVIKRKIDRLQKQVRILEDKLQNMQ